jgi:hypothetical protein
MTVPSIEQVVITLIYGDPPQVLGLTLKRTSNDALYSLPIDPTGTPHPPLCSAAFPAPYQHW